MTRPRRRKNDKYWEFGGRHGSLEKAVPSQPRWLHWLKELRTRSCILFIKKKKKGAVFYINKWFYINFRHSLWYKQLYHLPNYVLQLSKWENDIPSTQICLNISKHSLGIIYVMWWITLITMMSCHDDHYHVSLT